MRKKYFYDGRFWSKREISKAADQTLMSPPPRMRKAVAFVEGKRILDLGCGLGITAYLAAKKVWPDGEVTGVECLEDAVEIASERFKLPNLKFMVGDITNFKFPSSTYDCVMLLEVIEHIREPALLFRKIHKTLKPGGYLVLSTPNAASIDMFFQNLKPIDKIIESIDREEHGSGTETDHIYAWTLPILYRLLNRCGFGFVDYAFAGAGFPFPNIDRILGTKFTTWFESLYGRFGMNIILKVKKQSL